MDQKVIVAIIVVAIVGFGIGNYLGRINKGPFNYSSSKANATCPSESEINAACEQEGDAAMNKCEALLDLSVFCEKK